MESAEDRPRTVDFISLTTWFFSLVAVIVQVVSLLEKGRNAAAYLPLLSAVSVLLTNSKSVFNQLRGRKSIRPARQIGFAPREPQPPPPPLPTPSQSGSLRLSFANGFYGGSIGGGLSGLIIGVAYYLEHHTSDPSVTAGSILLSFVYASLVGAVIGSCTQFGIHWFRHLMIERRHPKSIFNEIVGGSLGGLLGGAIVGAVGGAIYEKVPGEPVSTGLLALVSGLVGVIPLVLGVVLYDKQRRLGDLRPALVSLVISAPIMAGLIFLLFGIEKLDLSSAGLSEAVFEGVVAGMHIGFMLGSLVGLVLFVDRWWHAHKPGSANETLEVSAKHR